MSSGESTKTPSTLLTDKNQKRFQGENNDIIYFLMYIL